MVVSFNYYVPPFEEWLADASPEQRMTAEDMTALEMFVQRDPGTMEPGQAEKLATLLIRWCLPNSWEEPLQNTSKSAVLLSQFARWDTLPREASIILISGYLNFIEQGDPSVEPGELSDMLLNSDYLDRKTYYDLVVLQLGKKSLTASDLGTAYRHLLHMDGGLLGDAETFWAFAGRPETPVEVVAEVMKSHVVPNFPTDGDMWAFRFDEVSFQTETSVKYPELDGLPWQMLFDVVASQPTDDTWRTDAWELPSVTAVPA